MSWQLSSFAVVVASLAAAFWWYERSHPPAKLIAVIATLAALAALGRDAFAAIPDVKPITAIVLVSGLAFGMRPGFAIGAVSALASNILLGQGPWTPWQMLGWGLVGVFGALLRRLLGEQPSALALGLACALGAELFNLFLNIYTWTGTGNHTLAAYGVVLGAALAFDLTHVGASFAFGFAFGPVLLRMLVRVRARLEVRWSSPAAPSTPRRLDAARLLGGPPAALLLVLCVPLAALGLTACANASKPAADPPAQQARLVIARELAYLKTAQNPDGGFGAAPGLPSSELYTAWAAIGLAAAGRSPLTLTRDGHSVLDALRAEAASLHGAGDLERTILALRACGAAVRSLPGGDPVQRLLAFRAADGSFSHLSNLTAFAILALRAAGYATHGDAPRRAPPGGWRASRKPTAASASACEAGAATSTTPPRRSRRCTAPARVTPPRWPAPPPSCAARRTPTAASRSSAAAPPTRSRAPGRSRGSPPPASGAGTVVRSGSRSPLGYLQTLQAPDGSVRYSRTGAQTPVWVTAQALTGLAQRPLPVAPPRP